MVPFSIATAAVVAVETVNATTVRVSSQEKKLNPHNSSTYLLSFSLVFHPHPYPYQMKKLTVEIGLSYYIFGTATAIPFHVSATTTKYAN